MRSPLDARQLALHHRALLKKGSELNARLVELLNHEGGERVLTPGVPPKPGERPVERLRRFMALVDSKTEASRPGAAPGYGLCESCEAPLPFIELEQLPFADRCRACVEPAHQDPFRP